MHLGGSKCREGSATPRPGLRPRRLVAPRPALDDPEPPGSVAENPSATPPILSLADGCVS